MRILLAEDDPVLSDGLARALETFGYIADLCGTGTDALQLLSHFSYNLAILDLGLPQLDGLEVLRSLRAKHNTVPVLILTARDTVEDRVLGLDSGADDYLAKPFTLKELEARIHALIRRNYRYNLPQHLVLGKLRFDVEGRQVYRDETLIKLTSRELTLLELLIQNPTTVISKARFIESLHGWREDITENAIEVYISRLRRKLVGCGVVLRALRGEGYALEAEKHG